MSRFVSNQRQREKDCRLVSIHRFLRRGAPRRVKKVGLEEREARLE